MPFINPENRKPSEESTSMLQADSIRISYIFLDFRPMLRGELYAYSFVLPSTPLLQLLATTNISRHLTLFSVGKLAVLWPLSSPGHLFLFQELATMTACPRWVPFPLHWIMPAHWPCAPLFMHWITLSCPASSTYHQRRLMMSECIAATCSLYSWSKNHPGGKGHQEVSSLTPYTKQD